MLCVVLCVVLLCCVLCCCVVVLCCVVLCCVVLCCCVVVLLCCCVVLLLCCCVVLKIRKRRDYNSKPGTRMLFRAFLTCVCLIVWGVDCSPTETQKLRRLFLRAKISRYFPFRLD